MRDVVVADVVVAVEITTHDENSTTHERGRTGSASQYIALWRIASQVQGEGKPPPCDPLPEIGHYAASLYVRREPTYAEVSEVPSASKNVNRPASCEMR